MQVNPLKLPPTKSGHNSFPPGNPRLHGVPHTGIFYSRGLSRPLFMATWSPRTEIFCCPIQASGCGYMASLIPGYFIGLSRPLVVATWNPRTEIFYRPDQAFHPWLSLIEALPQRHFKAFPGSSIWLYDELKQENKQAYPGLWLWLKCAILQGLRMWLHDALTQGYFSGLFRPLAVAP
jgi:hypothetical protein